MQYPKWVKKREVILGLGIGLCGLLLWLMFAQQKRALSSEARSEFSTTSDQPQDNQRRESPKEQPGKLTDPNPGDDPWSRDFRKQLQTVSLDRQREKQGLPPVMNSLVQARKFRHETEAEKNDPLLDERYRIDAKIHRYTWLIRHEREEVSRFRQSAAKAQSNQQRAFLEQVAGEHERLGQQYQAYLAQLQKQRAELM